MLDALRHLKNEIEENAIERGYQTWFYQEYSQVNGFEGVKDMFLVGLNPSSGTFPSRKDIRLYSLLEEKQLHDIHITDFIKIRATNNTVASILNNNVLIDEQAEFFHKEIEILKPKIIISMGRKCHELIRNIGISPSINIMRIKHYSYRYQSEDDVFEEISNSLDEIKKIYLSS